MEQGPSLPVQVAARKLLVDVTSDEVISALGSAGVRSILLKGPAIAEWLYESSSERPYMDCDLLIEPATFDQASACMTSLGFEQELEEVRPEGLPPKTQDWVRQRDGVVVELHRYLVGVKANPQLSFEEFVRDSVDIDLRGGRCLSWGCRHEPCILVFMLPNTGGS